ncbi:hypothetical protein [Enterococcus faecalis]|uniref:hypothetical protein n=1 Tax=Enterococcus faecalis TaxID=1351 RepID=UPI0021C9D5B8|nr:hypothetical protein [Enterococcus faecalis]
MIVLLLFLELDVIIDGTLLENIILLSLLTFFCCLAVIQVILPRSHYLMFIDQEKRVLNIYKNKVIPFTEIKSFVIHHQIQRGIWTSYLQLTTTPEFWCKFYKKNQRKVKRYSRNFQEMHIILLIGDQKISAINQFTDTLVKMSIPKCSFIPSVLGRYPNKIPKY